MVTCDEDDDDEEDILAEIGSENEDEEYEEHGEGDEILYLDDHGITINVTTRSGRNAIRFLLYKFKVSVIQFGPCCNTRSLSVGRGGWGGGGFMINYASHFGGSTFFLHLEWGGSPQNW